MGIFIQIVHIASALLLVLIIAIQQKGTGLSATFGGSGGGGFQITKRGPEKFLHYFTIVMAMVFVLTSVVSLFF